MNNKVKISLLKYLTVEKKINISKAKIFIEVFENIYKDFNK